MKVISKVISTSMLLALVSLAGVITASAQRQYRDSDTNMRNLIRRIETRTDSFSRVLENALDRSSLNGTSREDEVNRLVNDFEGSTDQLKTRFENGQSTAADVRVMLDRASLINRFLLNNHLESRVDQEWRLLQGDLDQLAQSYYINDWRWNGNVGGGGDYGSGSVLTNAQRRQLIQRIQNRTNSFTRSINYDLNSSRVNYNDRQEVRRHLNEFRTATNRLSIAPRDINTTDVQNALEHAAYLNSFVQNNQVSSSASSDWNLLRTDLDQLASAYNIAWNWSSYPGDQGSISGNYGGLTGTYRLNTSQSGNPQAAVDAATRNLPSDRRQRTSDALLRRLESPDVLAIDRRGTNVTIASSKAAQINFVADGREHVETTPNGRTVRVRASLSGDRLEITRTGERSQDFTVTFDPTDNGRRLIVTRRLYSDQFTQPVMVQSYYDRTSDVAQLDIYNGGSGYPNTGEVTGDFVIPSGTTVVAVLDSNLSTQNSHEGDQFTMTVRSPSQYDGARIDGHVSTVNRSGRITGRSEMTFNFDSIRLRDGRSYRFAGILESIRTPNNETVQVDNEGAVREDDQTGRTVTRTAIGTAIGAVIGAIAGGGKGAAIGAVVGAGAGAGSVYVQGRQDLELPSGTEVTIRSTGPR